MNDESLQHVNSSAIEPRKASDLRPAEYTTALDDQL